MKPKNNPPEKFILQQDARDCGVACLRNILLHNKATVSLEKLREWSGTDQNGTSLLGLQQAANTAGFTANGAQADGIDNLAEVTQPCILHVLIDESVQHYIVYYPRPGSIQKNRFLIGDPAKGLQYLNRLQLDSIWQSKVVLLLEPGPSLSRWQKQGEKKFKWFFQHLQQDLPLLTVAVLFGLIVAALNLSTAIFSQRLVDKILPEGNRQQLITGLSLLATVLLVKSIAGYLRQFLLARQSNQFNNRLTGGFFRSLLYLVKSFFDHRQTGDLIARLNDTLRIQQAVAYVLGEMAIQFLIMLASLVFLFIYAWPIGLFCLCLIPALFLLVRFFEKDILARQQEVMLAHSRNESNYVDTIRGISTIKVMNREGLFGHIAGNIFAVFQGAIFKLGKTRIKFNLALEITGVIFLVTVFLWGSLLVLNNQLQTGALIAILQMAGWLMQSAVMVALTNLQVQEAKVAFDRMYEFTTIEKEHENSDTTPFTSYPMHIDKLNVRNISFRFPGKKLLLQNVSLEARKGEIIALTGESGQGKSTIMQVLQKFYPYENGSIEIDDNKWENIPVKTWRQLIGVVPQDIAIFSGTLISNICLDDSPHHIEQVLQFCREYGFDRYFETFPQGYTTILGEGGIALSGGQKQLLALARCLYQQPKLLLLDEPTAAMDSATEEFVTNLLNRLKQETVTIIISHKDSLVQISDRVYMLQSGITTFVQKKKAVNAFGV